MLSDSMHSIRFASSADLSRVLLRRRKKMGRWNAGRPFAILNSFFKPKNAESFTDKEMIKIAKNFHVALTGLDVSYCEKLTDASVVAVAKHCPGLTSLVVSDCKNLTDTSVVAVAELCLGLTSLNVSDCKHFSGASIVAVAASLAACAAAAPVRRPTTCSWPSRRCRTLFLSN